MDFHLLKQEFQAQGELLATERIERKAEVDRLLIEIESLKKTLTQLLPEFSRHYDETHNDVVQHYDPALARKLA